MQEKIRIMVAPLDWGLGHATRCIPVIRELTAQGAEVLVAADGRAAQLLREEFPQLTHIHLEGYHVHYSSFLSTAWSIIFQLPKIIRAIAREHSQLKKIIREYKPDVVISDNRYGLWNNRLSSAFSKEEDGEKIKNVYTVFITHQLMVKLPKPIVFLEPMLHKFILSFVKRYNECWVPDVEGAENISGDLSHKYPLPVNAKYIGWLSRFTSANNTSEKKYDLLVLLSGTEPLRTELEKKIIGQIRASSYLTLLVRGVTEEQKQFSHQNNLTSVPYLGSHELLETMQKCDTIICRSGYSSLMDLAVTGKKAVLIPTPGQTEQEYLAAELMKKKKYFSSPQKKFNLDDALKASESYAGCSEIKFVSGISRAVDSLLLAVRDEDAL